MANALSLLAPSKAWRYLLEPSGAVQRAGPLRISRPRSQEGTEPSTWTGRSDTSSSASDHHSMKPCSEAAEAAVPHGSSAARGGAARVPRPAPSPAPLRHASAAESSASSRRALMRSCYSAQTWLRTSNQSGSPKAARNS
eukprot:scaffold151825_cov32-Tisochrysis_lutea.AAC.1